MPASPRVSRDKLSGPVRDGWNAREKARTRDKVITMAATAISSNAAARATARVAWHLSLRPAGKSIADDIGKRRDCQANPERARAHDPHPPDVHQAQHDTGSNRGKQKPFPVG
jgi:hypothetical protein